MQKINLLREFKRSQYLVAQLGHYSNNMHSKDVAARYKDSRKINRYKLRFTVLFILILTSLISAQTNIAIIPFEIKGISDIEAGMLIDRLGPALSNTGLVTVLDQGETVRILLNYCDDLADCDLEQKIGAVGQLLGAKHILFSSIVKTGNTFVVTGRLYDAGSGNIVQTARFDQWTSVAQLWNPGMDVFAQTIAQKLVELARVITRAAEVKAAPVTVVEQLVEPIRVTVPTGIQMVTLAPVQRDVFFISRIGVGHSNAGDTLSWGGQLGFSNNSGNKWWIDFLAIYDRAFSASILYELNLWRFFGQFGWGYIRDSDSAAFGYRVRLGFDVTAGKYIFIRPSVDLNLGFVQGQSGYAAGLDFGIRIPPRR